MEPLLTVKQAAELVGCSPAAIRKWITQRRLRAVKVGPCPSEGTRDYRWAKKTFPVAVRAAGIENFGLHDTRHTFTGRLAMAGVELLTIKALGGWKSLPMVARYAHPSPEHGRAAIERLANRSWADTSSSAGNPDRVTL